MRRSAMLMFAFLAGGPAAGMGLLDAYREAQQNDTDFRVQRLDRDASQINRDIARGALLPNVSLTATNTGNSGDRTISGAGTDTTQPLNYQSRVASINLRQPLYNSEGMVRFRQGKLQGEIADSVLEAKRMELAINVATTFFDGLLARENVAFGEAESAAAQEQVRLAQRRFEGGEGTLTEIAEAQARRDLAEARLIEARDQVAIATGALERLTGATRVVPAGLKGGPIALPLSPATLPEWIQIARERNTDVQSLRLQVENAALDIERARAGHLPRLDLVASLTNAKNDTLNTLNTASSIRAVGVQFTLPIYSGGAVSAGTEQAVVNRDKARAAMDAAANAIAEKTRKQYLATASAAGKIAAYGKAVASAAEALKGNRLGFQAGIRTNLDVLNAQSQVFAAQRDLAQARHAYLVGVVTLKAVAGVLTEEAMAEIDSLLESGTQ